MKTLIATLLCVLAVQNASALPNASNVSTARAGGWSPKPGEAIVFDVLREGKPFGTHSVRFEEAADGGLIARTRVNLKAGLGPVILYRYSLDASETWKAGELSKFTGTVDNDGRRGNVRAVKKNGTLSVNGTAYAGDAPQGAVPSSHWNYAQTRATHLVSTEDGKIISVKVTPKGRETIKAAGKSIEANRYFLDSDIDVDLWYDESGRWVKLAFAARGQLIEYVLANDF